MMRSKLIPPLLGYYTMAGGGAATPWYLSGGIAAANCLAAYQPKGAASLAASYVNLVNPGTYDAAPGVAPGFDTALGWTTDGSKWLTTNIALQQTYTIICRFTNSSSTDKCIMGAYDSTTNNMLLAPEHISGKVGYWCGNNIDVAPAMTEGVLAVVGRYGYRNGTVDTVQMSGYAGSLTAKCALMACGSGASTLANRFIGTFIAAAIYDATLTAPQMAAVSTAMAAL